MQIIKNRAICTDDFQKLTDDSPLPQGGKVLVSLERWNRDFENLSSQFAACGIVLPSDKLPKDIQALNRLALIAITFPRFTDGRGYSIAKLLRTREKFQGDIRATGWVLRDNLLYMERCGFTSFELKDGKPLESGLEAFSELAIPYQATVQDARPLYRRRA